MANLVIYCIKRNYRNPPWDQPATILTLKDTSGKVWEREALHDALVQGIHRAFVETPTSRVEVLPKTNKYGTKYVQTVSNGLDTDNLIDLDDCP